MPTEPVPEASETFFGLVLLWRQLPKLPFKELGPVLQNFDLNAKYSTSGIEPFSDWESKCIVHGW